MERTGIRRTRFALIPTVFVMDIKEVFSLISKGIAETASSRGFKVVMPDGIKSGECPVFEDEKESYLLYSGEKGFIKISLAEGKAYFLIADPVDSEDVQPEFSSVCVSIFDPANSDEKDIKYIINEYNDCIGDKFKSNEKKSVSDIKLPPPVSKAAAKNGTSFYDPNTLANRFTVLYPELRVKFKENIEKYGEFLPDEFFSEYGKAAIDTIKQNEKQQMKKLFNLLNDIYLDGTNETQSIIAVTILGQLNNDTELLANCVDYMDPDLASAVINVNKYLASSSGKKAVRLLKNPPRYKPPKEKKIGK